MAAETAQVRDAQLFSSMCYRKLLFRAVTYTLTRSGVTTSFSHSG
jgi:hypothetical protein